jgi:tRNA pseudouridine55 synthase
MDGFIVVDKPAGMTSHDVVSSVRRLAGMKKVGHTGTLDPFATGVLPVALGEATKAIPFLDESVKEYRAVMRLGEGTDTQDFTGSVIRRGEWQGLTTGRIEAAARLFIGRGSQIPPMYSALKRDGVPLYRLARRGEEVRREPREIEIYSLVIDRIDLPDVAFTVRCSRGVYVRTLASDLGDRLGCGAHLAELRRTASGPFELEQALTMEKLADVTGRRELPRVLISCHAALAHLRDLPLTATGAARVVHGIAPEAADLQMFPDGPLGQGERMRLSRDGKLLAVAESTAEGWPVSGEKPNLLRVFNEPKSQHCLYISGLL